MRRSSSNAIVALGTIFVGAVALTIAFPTPGALPDFAPARAREVPGAPKKLRNHQLNRIQIVNFTLVRLSEAYVDRQRIDPQGMLFGALESVQFRVPEVFVTIDRKSKSVEVSVGSHKQRFSAAGIDSLWSLAGNLKKIFRFIEAHVSASADLAEVEYAAVNGMLRTLDPHSVLLDPESAREMDVSTSGKFGGLGILIRMKNRKLTVVRPIKGTPAATAGIRAGDHIYQINDEVTENLTLSDSITRMRGEPGTPIVLTIKRATSPQPLRVEITRAIIRVESVISKLLDNKVGYIRLKQFSGRTTEEVQYAMQRLKAAGANGWLLDLRANPGGLLEQSIQISDLFVDRGTLVTTVEGSTPKRRRASARGTDTTSPMAVLVNGNSASASEIVAGALKNLNRAVIIGTRTFGKGSVQVLYDNKKNGSKLKLTIAQYLTPGDKSIQSVGITPDIQLQRQRVPAQNTKPSHRVRLLPPSESQKEANLAAHLTSSYASKPDKPVMELAYLYGAAKPAPAPSAVKTPKAPGSAAPATKDSSAPDDKDTTEANDIEDEELDDEFVEDFEIRFGKQLVARSRGPVAKSAKANRGRHRLEMLKVAKGLVATTTQEQHKALTDAMQRLGVDWSRQPSEQKAKLRLEVTSHPKASVKAGDIIELRGVVTNIGTTPAHRVHARAQSEDYHFHDAELVFGALQPQQSRNWTTRIRIPNDAVDRISYLTFTMRAAGPLEATTPRLKLRIHAAKRPTFAYSYQLVDNGDATSNGDGLLQRGETLRLRVQVKNTGVGPSQETTALLSNASGDGIVVKKGRFELGPLGVNATKTVDFTFQVTDKLKAAKAHLELTVQDASLEEVVSEKLSFRLHRPVKVEPYKRRVIVQSAKAPIRQGAHASANVIGWAPKSAVFQVTGRTNAWLRVELKPGHSGFLRVRNLRETTRQLKPAVLSHWQVTPPAIRVTVSDYETSDAEYHLQGVATDATRVADVYVFVSNRKAKVYNRKVYYRSDSTDPKRMSLDHKIPLWPGSNRVTIVARENDDVRAYHTIYLHRAAAAPLK